MKTTGQPIDINPTHLETIQRILNKHVPDCEVRAFGSRAKWNAEDYSDLDLAVVGDQPLEWRMLSRLEMAFEESDLPFRVDVLDWHDISDKFRKLIEADCIALVEANRHDDRKETTVGGFAPFNYGKALKKDERNSAGSVPVYGSNGIVGWHDEAVTQGPTVVVGRKGTVGAVHYSPVPCWPIDTTFFVTGQDPELVRFQYYALKSLKLDSMNSDSAVPGLNREAAHARSLKIPPSTEQRSVAHVLGTLDDKIDLNRRMNETLEAMAQALFKSWFIDFDPVRAKMEGQWQPGESLPGLPAHLYNLFPDRLVPSELGEIPEGWKVRRFGDAVEQLREIISPLDSPHTLYTHFSIPSFDKDKWPSLEKGASIKSQKSHVSPETILISKLNPENKRVWLVDVEKVDDAICSTEFLVLKPRLPYSRLSIYFLSRSDKFHRQLLGLVTGTSKSHQRVPAKSILNLTILLPPTLVLQSFESTALPIVKVIQIHMRESHNIIAQRDILISKLTRQRQ